MVMQCLKCLEKGEWCGGLCINDPEKRNGLIFWPDGRVKTLAERGLSLTDEERGRAQRHMRRGAESVTETAPVVTESPLLLPKSVTETPPVVTETPPVVTESPSVVTESVTETPSVTKIGRPKLEKKLTAAEKMRRYRERVKRERGDG